MTAPADCEAIDVHGHYGPYDEGKSTLMDRLMTGDAETVLRRARIAGTRLTIVSPIMALMPRGACDPVGGNEDAARVVAGNESFMQWVVVDPQVPETYKQAERMLESPRCAGIKVHPEEHLYRIVDHGRAIFEFAAKHRKVIITHSGEKNSLPEDYIPFADDFPEVRLIVSHLGFGHDDDPGHQVRAIQKSKHGNVFTDTSSSKSIVSNLLEWAVAEIGAERILYGTDSPLYFAPMQRARVEKAELSNEEKCLILCGNAEKLFGL